MSQNHAKNLHEPITTARAATLRRIAGQLEADPHCPYWIVVCLSKQDVPTQLKKINEWRGLFRHSTVDEAAGEAARLAQLHPGKRFSVFASGPSFKVESGSTTA